MSKKKLLLNESVTRRFMKLATIKPLYVSNFLTEAEEEEMMLDEPAAEPEMGMEPEMEADPEMDAEMEVEDEMAPEEGGDSPAAEEMVMGLLAKVKEFAEENGVSMELEGDEGAMDGEEAELEGGDMELADDEEMPPEDDADVDADLEAADVEVADEEEIIAEVTRRVARRLLRESATRKR